VKDLILFDPGDWRSISASYRFDRGHDCTMS
jgi:hypothetical protein